jgi:hypothetical protein
MLDQMLWRLRKFDGFIYATKKHKKLKSISADF